jgi:hypothetical protein
MWTDGAVISCVVNKSKDTRDAGYLGVLVKDLEVSIVKRQMESVDVASL